MASVASVCDLLEQSAPHQLAEEWDNVGLLVGDSSRQVSCLMTCLTVTPASAAEAIERGVEMIVTHHPLPFHQLRRVTSETTTGRLLLQLIEAGVAIYSSHTAFDSSEHGINQQLAEGIGLVGTRPLLPGPEASDALGTARVGEIEPAATLAQLASTVSRFLDIPQVQVVGDTGRQIERVAVACGSGGGFLDEARRAGCDLLVTGEARFHTCLEAEATGIALVLAGHFASERFALERLAVEIAQQLPEVETFASQQETDPLRWVPGSQDATA